jgi:hypothetical protein
MRSVRKGAPWFSASATNAGDDAHQVEVTTFHQAQKRDHAQDYLEAGLSMSSFEGGGVRRPDVPDPDDWCRSRS